MVYKRCIVLIDATEVLVRTYQKLWTGDWQLIAQLTRDLTPFDDTYPTADMAEIIAPLSTDVIYARHIPEAAVAELQTRLHRHIEELTLVQEQDLLCRGIIGTLAG